VKRARDRNPQIFEVGRHSLEGEHGGRDIETSGVQRENLARELPELLQPR